MDLNNREVQDITPHNIPLARFTKVLKSQNFSIAASSQQLKYWSRRENLQPHYLHNIQYQLTLAGAVPHSLVTHAINELSKRHLALRTVRGNVTGGGFNQYIRKLYLVSVPVISIDDAKLTRVDYERECNRIARIHGQSEFNLEEGPLFRACLVQADSDDGRKLAGQTLIMSAHKSILDAVSLEIILQEFMCLCNGEALPHITVNSADYGAWQQECLTSEFYQECKHYWHAQLEDLPPSLNLPFTQTRSPITRNHSERCALVFSKSLSKKIKTLAERETVSISSILLSGLTLLLSHYSGQSDIIVGLQSSNRDVSGFESAVGNVESLRVVRSQVDLQRSFKKALMAVVANLALAERYQQIGECALETMALSSGHAEGVPLCQVTLDFDGRSKHSTTLNGRVGNLEKTEHDICFHICKVKKRFEGYLEYNSDLFNISTIKRMSRYYLRLLRALIDRVHRPLAELSLLRTVEGSCIVKDRRQTKVQFPRDHALST